MFWLPCIIEITSSEWQNNISLMKNIESEWRWEEKMKMGRAREIALEFIYAEVNLSIGLSFQFIWWQ